MTVIERKVVLNMYLKISKREQTYAQIIHLTVAKSESLA